MTLGERIKKIRRDNDLTQQQFAEKIGSTQNVLANYEAGRRNPSSSVINNICKTFNVREAWLRTGEGRPFVELPRNEALTAQINAFLQGGTDSFRERLVSLLLRLAPEQWDALESYLMELMDTPAPVGDSKQETSTQTEPDIMSELAELKRQNAEIQRQNQELSARLSAMEEDDELGWPSDTGNLA